MPTLTPRDYVDQGVSIIPCGHPQDPKRPIAPWVHAQTSISDPGDATHYGAVCGAVSGHLECIDYDKKHDTHGGETWDAYRSLIQATHPYLWERLLLERSQSGGVHIVYRCPDVVIPGNQKLASVQPPQAVFETRGEGGYYICAPAPGYELIQGNYENIPVLTAEERELLITAAQTFDLRPTDTDRDEGALRAHTAGTMGYEGLSPFDDYDQRADVVALLHKHGWRTAYTRGGATYLTRPGKKMGVSATWNYIPNRLYVFTTSTEFDAHRTYKPCAVLAYLEHDGDFKDTAHHLVRQGYGKRSDGVTRKRRHAATPDNDDDYVEPSDNPNIVDPEYIIECCFQGNMGDGDLALRIFDNTVIFDPALGRWCIFDHHELKPGHWGVDPTDEGSLVMRLVQQTLTGAYHNAYEYCERSYEQNTDMFASNTGAGNMDAAEVARTRANADKVRMEALKKRIKEMQSVGYSRKVVAELKALALIHGSEWDSDPMVLGVANGVVDLRNGSLRPAHPLDYIRRVSPTAYDPDAKAPRFVQFLHEIHGEDHTDPANAPISDFMHRLLGYGITGNTTEHIYPILWGHEGRNGKDTLLDALHLVLGNEIAKPASKDTVVVSGRRNTGSATPELYDLWGARLVWVNETEESDRIKAAQLKELSGGSIIKCRPLHGNMVEFKPTHLGLLITNHKPNAPSDDSALWERLVLIPYTQRFLSDPDPNKTNEHPADKALGATLRAEAQGILTWLVQGCIRWRDEGLTIPPILKEQTKSYRSELDTITEWIDEAIIPRDGGVMRAKDAYKQYEQWALDNGHFAYKQRRFSQAIQAAGFTPIKDTDGIRGRGYRGGVLRSQVEVGAGF